MRRWRWCLLSVVLLATTSASLGRKFSVRSEAELLGALERGASRVVFDVAEVTLRETVVVRVDGVSLEGKRKSGTTIRCDNLYSHAVLIKAANVKLSGLKFQDCSQSSAVAIKGRSGAAEEEMAIEFRGVSFVNNGRKAEGVLGGAVSSPSCRRGNCRRVALHFVDCRFDDNHASLGGAIYAVEADLRIRDSIFTGNEANLTDGAGYSRNRLGATVEVQSADFAENVAFANPESLETGGSTLERTVNLTAGHAGTGGAIHLWNPRRLAVQNSTFSNNTGCSGGGAIAVFTADPSTQRDLSKSIVNSRLSFSTVNSRFEDNGAFCGSQTDALDSGLTGKFVSSGGALLYAHSNETQVEWRVERTVFRRNRAHSGGAIFVKASSLIHSFHNLTRSSFTDNAALISGGSVFVSGAHLEVTAVSIRSSRAIYGGALIMFSTSSLKVRPHPEQRQSESLIENCTAVYGGGIFLFSSGPAELCSLTIRNSTAFRYGGGLRAFQSTEEVTLSGVQIEKCTALAGGGISVFGGRPFHMNSANGKFSVVKGNTAAVGGGLYYEDGHTIFLDVKVENASFVQNRAMRLDSDEIRALVQEEATFQPLPAQRVEMPYVDGYLEEDETLFSFLTEIGEGNGGGIAISLLNAKLFTLAQLTFRNLNISENQAIVGGGVSVYQTDLHWNQGSQENRQQCFAAAVGLDPCQRFDSHNVNLTGNSAEYAAGVFTTLPEGIAISCPGGDSVTAQEAGDEGWIGPDLQEYCTSMEGNTISADRGFWGRDLGTGAAKLAALPRSDRRFDDPGQNGNANLNKPLDHRLKHVASGEPLAFPCSEGANKSCDEGLRIWVLDAIRQPIRLGIPDANLTLVLSSSNIFGDVRYQAVNGSALINNTFARGVNVSSTVVISSEEDPTVRVELAFTTRECYPGELLDTDVCRQCPDDQYGFDPLTKKCEACEDNAECDGGAALVPSPGYWHSTPFSPLFSRCIQREACQFAGRQRHLTEFYADGAEVKACIERLDAFLDGKGPKPDFLKYIQCDDGYDGVLCGSCQPGYGHSYSGACQKCPQKVGKRGFFLLAGALWLSFLIGVNCTVTLYSTKARIQSFRHELTGRTNSDREFPNRDRPISGIRRPSSLALYHLRSTPAPCGVGGRRDQQIKLRQQQLVLTVQLSETLKILINYLQVTVAAAQLQTDWNGLLEGLLTTEAVFTGVSQEVVDVPYECNFEHASRPPSIIALWLRLATPLFVLVLLLFTFSAGWFIVRSAKKAKKSESALRPFRRQRYVTYLIIICLVTMYFSFTEMFRNVLRTMNCVHIEEDEVGSSNHPYQRYATERGKRRVWAEDTDLVCFQGHHLFLGVVGIIGLTFLLFGVVLIVLWLPLNKKYLTKKEFVARYWFIYQAYRRTWYTNAWESMILTRKALIAAIVVFSTHLRPALQCSLCVGVLIIAHVLHSILLPFKTPGNDDENVPEYAGDFLGVCGLHGLSMKWVKFHNGVHLNTLESLSLFSSISFFFSAIVLADNDSSTVGRALMVAFTFSLNVMFLLYMLYRLYAGLHVLVDLKLEITKPAFIANYPNAMGVVSLIRKSLALLFEIGFGAEAGSDGQKDPFEESDILDSVSDLADCT